MSGPDQGEHFSPAGPAVVYPAKRCSHLSRENRATHYVRMIKVAQNEQPAEFHDVGMCAACFARFLEAANNTLAE